MANELNDIFAWHIARLRKLGVTVDDISIMTSYGSGSKKEMNWAYWTIFIGKKMLNGGPTWFDMERRVTSYLNGNPSDQNKTSQKGKPRGKS